MIAAQHSKEKRSADDYGMTNAVWNEADDTEIEYGKLYSSTVEAFFTDELKLYPPIADIWPHWSEGVPTTLRRRLGSPAFEKDEVKYKYREYHETLHFEWRGSYKLPKLATNKRLLPARSGGVYRIFAPSTSIPRCCGIDSTGTLYLGSAGTQRNWSNLRTRVKSIVDCNHHAMNNLFNERVRNTFPHDSLAVEWAYMRARQNYQGISEHDALLGEAWLLRCYHDSFGEYPPWNEKG